MVSFETPHNYPNNLNCHSGTYTCPSAHKASVHAKYDTETWYDYFYIQDNETQNANAYSGNSTGYNWIDTNYRSVRFQFTSDEA